MRVEHFQSGISILGRFPDEEVLEEIRKATNTYPLIICDPPYGNIASSDWDKFRISDVSFSNVMVQWAQACQSLSTEGGAMLWWGGIGKPLYRPFYRFLTNVEEVTAWRMANHITWSKKRAYGLAYNYLFTREELAYFVYGDIKKPRAFNIPLLEQKRGYAGYDKLHPAKSEYLRRTNVWTDITEIMKGKIHECEKPSKVYQVIVQTHSNPGDWILDPFTGSGVTGLVAAQEGRKFCLVESNEEIYETQIKRLKSELL